MPPRSDSERYENAALRLKNGTPRAWQSLPWVTNRAAARWAKEGSTVVPTVKDTGVAISLACEQRPAQLQSIGRAILRHGPNIKHRRCGMTVRHLSAKTAKTTPGACTTGTVMLPSDAALRLKFGSCEDDGPSRIHESRCCAVLVVEPQFFLDIGWCAQVQKV